jgi:PHP domain/AAA domain
LELVTSWARFWAVDLHVHTPGSADARAENYGTADDIIAAATAAGLDAIAITDHNTTESCDALANAAKGQPIVVLPGVEISTNEGHLLAIWEEGTDSADINDVLARLGIRKADRGKLDIAAEVGFADAAREVAEAGGIAIAAHIDKPKGLLGITVASQMRKTLMEPCLCGVELVDLDKRGQVDQKVPEDRVLAIVQGSDTWDASISQHGLVGIGSRRTWIKASRPDLVGLKHALADPDLRIRVGSPPEAARYPIIDSVELVGGFLSGQRVELCPDLNCMVGGTGAGKSLILEAIRYALDQQVDSEAFPAIGGEVTARLKSALGAGMVRVDLQVDGSRYRVERAHSPDSDSQPYMAIATAAREELVTEAQPRLDELQSAREALLSELHDERNNRRELRRARVDQLNSKTARFVKLDVPSNGDCSQYRAALDIIKVGSRVKDDVLQATASTIHPFQFARLLWAGDVNSLVTSKPASMPPALRDCSPISPIKTCGPSYSTFS